MTHMLYSHEVESDHAQTDEFAHGSALSASLNRVGKENLLDQAVACCPINDLYALGHEIESDHTQIFQFAVVLLCSDTLSNLNK